MTRFRFVRFMRIFKFKKLIFDFCQFVVNNYYFIWRKRTRRRKRKRRNKDHNHEEICVLVLDSLNNRWLWPFSPCKIGLKLFESILALIFSIIFWSKIFLRPDWCLFNVIFCCFSEIYLILHLRVPHYILGLTLWGSSTCFWEYAWK